MIYSSESKDIWHDANPSKDTQNTALRTPAYCSKDTAYYEFYYPKSYPKFDTSIYSFVSVRKILVFVNI